MMFSSELPPLVWLSSVGLTHIISKVEGGGMCGDDGITQRIARNSHGEETLIQ